MHLDELYSIHSKPKSKSNNLFKLYIIIAFVAVLSFSFARYVVGGNVNVFIDIAKFNIDINDTPLTVDNNNLSDVIDIVIDENGAEDGIIRCGQKGHFDIKVDATNTETNIEYMLTVNTEHLPEGFVINQYAVDDFSVRNSLNSEKTVTGEMNLNGRDKLDENDVKIYRFFFEWNGNYNIEIADYMIDLTAKVKQKLV